MHVYMRQSEREGKGKGEEGKRVDNWLSSKSMGRSDLKAEVSIVPESGKSQNLFPVRNPGPGERGKRDETTFP